MPIDTRTHLQNIERIRVVMVAAQEHRKTKTAQVYDETEGCMASEWVLFERRAVLTEVNAIRTERGLPLADERTLLCRAEQPAMGHCDYTTKYALYAAELAAGCEHAPH